ATTYEIGTKYSNNKLYAALSTFYRAGRDFIDWTRSDTTLPWMPQNYFSVNTTGINIQGQYQLLTNKKISSNLYAGFTYLHPQLNNGETSILSRYIINSLKHQFVIRAHFAILEHIDVTIANRYLNRLNANNNNTHRIRNYNLMDLRLGYNFSQINIYADCRSEEHTSELQ